MIEIKIILKMILSIAAVVCDICSCENCIYSSDRNTILRNIKYGLFLLVYVLWVFDF